MSDNFSILPVHLAVQAMRDSGYKNAAYALAELIDNALQAGAQHVDVICREEEVRVSQRKSSNLRAVGILDNGSGMTPDALRAALQFGNGQYLNDRSGIGRFGMGLPSSSISQAKRVDVWTWQNGTDTAIHTYLDLDEIQNEMRVEVPEPKAETLPNTWLKFSRQVGQSGTFVVWSKIDRCKWKTAKSLLSNSEDLIGRMYRRFIDSGRSSIRMVSVNKSDRIQEDYHVRPNDPLYLMSGTSCPWPKGEIGAPMFKQYGEPVELKVKDLDGTEHEVSIRYSTALPEARSGANPGAKPHGKHASRNIGVSVMRADRELDLQVAGWTVGYNPVERWWGCEVDIPTELDEVFGVTNNKQSANALAEIAALSEEQIAGREDFGDISGLIEHWKYEGDMRLILLQIKKNIESQLSTIRGFLAAQTRGSRSRKAKRHESGNSPESKGTQVIDLRKKQGHKGSSDIDESRPQEERVADVAKDLETTGISEDEAKKRARQIVVEDQRKFEFIHEDLDTSAFFSVRPKGGVLLIKLNTSHAAYQHLISLAEEDLDNLDPDKLKSLLYKSHDGLKLLLEAWARYEDELPPEKKDLARDVRRDWGRIAREFLRDE